MFVQLPHLSLAAIRLRPGLDFAIFQQNLVLFSRIWSLAKGKSIEEYRENVIG
jgi:hypothetical protein